MRQLAQRRSYESLGIFLKRERPAIGWQDDRREAGCAGFEFCTLCDARHGAWEEAFNRHEPPAQSGIIIYLCLDRALYLRGKNRAVASAPAHNDDQVRR